MNTTLTVGLARTLAVTLKMGFYRVRESGNFMECDDAARDVFGIPKDTPDLEKHSFAALYASPDEREKRIEDLRSRNGAPAKYVLVLRIGEEERLVLDICWLDQSPDNEGGVVGVVEHATDVIPFPTIASGAPLGFYAVDDENRFIRCNEFTARMLGLDNPSGLLGKPLDRFYKKSSDMAEHAGEVATKGYAQRIIEMRKENGDNVIVEVFSQHVAGPIPSRWGIAMDVTMREWYYRALDTSPVAYYLIGMEPGKPEKILRCNGAFAKMFGFESVEQAIGSDVELMNPKGPEKTRFLQAVQEADERGEPL